MIAEQMGLLEEPESEEKVEKFLIELMELFPNSFINSAGELILHKRRNIYIVVHNVSSRQELIAKLLIWCSRDFAHRHLSLAMLNEYADLDLSKRDIELIYAKIGNGIKPDLAKKFIASGFDMNILRKASQ